jgi:hypothetical protein
LRNRRIEKLRTGAAILWVMELRGQSPIAFFREEVVAMLWIMRGQKPVIEN